MTTDNEMITLEITIPRTTAEAVAQQVRDGAHAYYSIDEVLFPPIVEAYHATLPTLPPPAPEAGQKYYDKVASENFLVLFVGDQFVFIRRPVGEFLWSLETFGKSLSDGAILLVE